jgi:hypothetical protein
VQFADYSPPSSPSLDQQRDTFQKGLGRAMQWAMARRLEDGPLLAACLRDLRYDSQVEDTRGDWLWRMIRALGAADRFRVPILHALHALSDGPSAGQLCELAGHYAEAGDEAFRMRLYDIVEQKPIADSPWLGEEEIVQLDGEEAFLFAARARGRRLADREWDWDDAALVQHAIGRFGETRTNDLIERATDGEIGPFREGWKRWQKDQVGRQQGPSLRDRMRAITVGDIISAAESNSTRFWLFRGWGRHADAADLGTVLQCLWAAREPKVIANLLAVFSNRALPQFDTRLIELCGHGDDEVRRRALGALEQNAHPRIRRFALDELEGGERGGSVVGLFAGNYQQGDEQRILESVELPDDDCELHGLLMDVIKVLEKNPDADCSRLGIIAYASTPCENCRADAARLLHRRRVAPSWLTEECRFDSSEECRGLVGEVASQPQSGSESR